MTEGARLPGVESEDDDERIVLHVDADCFYASCERLREPELREEPVVVGMGYEAGDATGAVATASYEAREFGVESAMAIGEALDQLPRRVDARDDPEIPVEESGHYRPVDMDFYESVSADVREILHDCADVVREVSIDESYLDVTERTAWGVADGFARHVKDRIRREVGITVSVGVAPTMSAAKIASDFDKPDGLTVVRPGEVAEFLAPLDVELLHGVGPVTARELREMGLVTAGAVADADPEPLVERFGERGRELYERARGEDDRIVTPRGDPKSFSRESAFGDPVEALEPKREQIRTLAAAVADRARREEALYRTVGIKVVTPPYDVNTRERSLPGPVDDPELVEEIALDQLAEFADDRVRKLGVRVSNLEFAAGDQVDLDGWDATTIDGGPQEAQSRADRASNAPANDDPTGDHQSTTERQDDDRGADEQMDLAQIRDAQTSDAQISDTQISDAQTSDEHTDDDQTNGEQTSDERSADGGADPVGADPEEPTTGSESPDRLPAGQTTLTDFE